MECDYLNGWIKKPSHTQKMSPKNGEPQRYSWRMQKKNEIGTVDLCHSIPLSVTRKSADSKASCSQVCKKRLTFWNHSFALFSVKPDEIQYAVEILGFGNICSLVLCNVVQGRQYHFWWKESKKKKKKGKSFFTCVQILTNWCSSDLVC